MPPKKQKQKQKQSHPSDPRSAPKLQISAENERRLRRLLLNSSSATAPSPSTTSSDSLSKAQKAKKLKSLYEKLSCEGFVPDQIESALSTLNEGATFESALDWLCLNVPGDELPLKFSTGALTFSLNDGLESSVKVISTVQEDWVPSRRPLDGVEEQMPGFSIKTNGKRDEELLDLGKPTQADWIRDYVQRQEEETDPCVRAESIAKEYHRARAAALEAKERGDKKNQNRHSQRIHELKLEISSLGLSDEVLELGLEEEDASNISETVICDSTTSKLSHPELPPYSESCPDTDALMSKPLVNGSRNEGCILEVVQCITDPLGVPDLDKVIDENNEPEDLDLELDSLFLEDASSSATLHPGVSKIQRKENVPQVAHREILRIVDDIGRKGDSGKTPKAFLQQLCQRLGWEAPKYSKLFEKENKFSYSVSVLRTTIGRGKSRKSGGLLTFQLPNQIEETFRTVEDAQNNVAAYALHQLFPDVSVQQLIAEPYASLVKKWQEGEISTTVDDGVETRKADFVDSLLSADTCGSVSPIDSATANTESDLGYQLDSVAPVERFRKTNYHKQVESSSLKQELKNKKKLPKYLEMLEARASLPIAEMKSHLLQSLKENDVLVVCGETGCGKTTQVPQYILDDMIELGLGGHCDIVCTQPRRIAAMSVAERVADERCEPPPGSSGSIVGYQVRLDSARNEKTKLLFCTTGILLRKLSGDRDLNDITHVIVDEVHERSLLGDFLLVVLKELVKNRLCGGRPKLKVVLMSATVDSSLFSRYFGNCPVISAEGRIHPVSTYFLEDVHEILNYCLPSDSSVSGSSMTLARRKSGTAPVDNRRGKKNLVLSSWGDESLLSQDYINPYYSENSYESYSERTRQNLINLNEDVIDYDLLEDLICYIDEAYPLGAILVFLPGVSEIYLLVDRLAATYRFSGLAGDWLLPLHSSLASSDQRKVFLPPPPNVRKVIVATDIAETSITIDDVLYVIDCGKHKESRYNPQKKMSSMVEDWISQANAKQRQGRAGRVKPGNCFRLYTRHRFENLMRSFQVPEMLRMPLVELCLQIKSLSLGDIKLFLSKAIEPPREDAIVSAIGMLYQVGAFEGNEELTPLGYHLAKLPVDVLIGKIMLYGAIFGCLSPVLTIAACLGHKVPFVYPKDEKQTMEKAKSLLLNDKPENERKYTESNGQSDHLLMVVAYNKWTKILNEEGSKAAHKFCNSFFLSSTVMYTIRDMRIQFGSLLADIGLIHLPKFFLTDMKMKNKLDNWFADVSQPFNRYSHYPPVIKSVLCAGLYPNIAASQEGIHRTTLGSSKAVSSSPATKDNHLWYDARREVHVHPCSVNCNRKNFHYPFLVFLEKVETTKIFLRDTSIVSPYSILLFGGSINVQHQTGLIIIDGWLKLTAPAQIAVLFKELRLTLHAVLKELISKPEMATTGENEVVRSIVHLLLEEGKHEPS
ncbi:putative pre-mRNA-splicing factor ATP-dependent RNA helicase [Acorus gramineus]|uniref:RNA helicase n=1 Tax=Acorus gramineus TaxID=55184 RepID=A0AAV9A2V5_ACOGR|nr:putative pre-mRNA-splicing factor ATP-dependent RNA helicase [Acorus gramineus]